MCHGAVAIESPWDDELRTMLAEMRAAAWDTKAWSEVVIAVTESHATEASRVCGRAGRATVTLSVAQVREIRSWRGGPLVLRFLIAHELAHLALPHGPAMGERTLQWEQDADARAMYYIVRAGYDCVPLLTLLNRFSLKRPSGHREHLARACAAAKRSERP